MLRRITCALIIGFFLGGCSSTAPEREKEKADVNIQPAIEGVEKNSELGAKNSSKAEMTTYEEFLELIDEGVSHLRDEWASLSWPKMEGEFCPFEKVEDPSPVESVEAPVKKKPLSRKEKMRRALLTFFGAYAIEGRKGG